MPCRSCIDDRRSRGSHNRLAQSRHDHAVDAAAATLANQQPDALQKSNSAASELSLARFGLRIIRAMQPSHRARRDG